MKLNIETVRVILHFFVCGQLTGLSGSSGPSQSISSDSVTSGDSPSLESRPAFSTSCWGSAVGVLSSEIESLRDVTMVIEFLVSDLNNMLGD
jgi:hypothetical protein